jgi:hypothetical protein
VNNTGVCGSDAGPNAFSALNSSLNSSSLNTRSAAQSLAPPPLQ